MVPFPPIISVKGGQAQCNRRSSSAASGIGAFAAQSPQVPPSSLADTLFAPPDWLNCRIAEWKPLFSQHHFVAALLVSSLAAPLKSVVGLSAITGDTVTCGHSVVVTRLESRPLSVMP